MPETRTVTFNYTGAVQTFEVPSGVRQITIDCYGAQGANGVHELGVAYGGKGGRAKGTFQVTPGEVLFIYVGGQGLYVYYTTSYTGGWNGGGKPYMSESGYRGSGGGGASDVRRGGQSLNNRIIVAGGGGGGGNVHYQWYYVHGPEFAKGGGGGGLTGESAPVVTSKSPPLRGGGGGTQTSGGTNAFGRNGSFGYGADGIDYNSGCGGGGWYGGASGDSTGGGGGGGSGYIHPSATNQLFETGVRSGHGLVIITYEVIPPLYVRVNGQLKESESIHVRVNGQLREVDKIWAKVNGQLREV